MGSTEFSQIGYDEKLSSISKFFFFENENLNIKKISCGGIFFFFNIFLTGLSLFYHK
jgi:hypothetical protein